MSGFTTKPRSATWRYAPPDLFSEDNFYPVTTTGWRWIACELMAYRSDEGGENTQRTTIATDVWSFAMTVIEVRDFATSLLYMANTERLADSHRIYTIFTYQK